VNIEVAGNELSITGEIKEKERKGALRRRTRRTGRFEYRVKLPEQVEASKIDASLDQGVQPSRFRSPSAPNVRRSRSSRSEARALRLPVASGKPDHRPSDRG
jgi:HSP20 family protein